MKNEILNSLFDPSKIKYFYTSSDVLKDKESDKIVQEYIVEEMECFKEICEELEKDMIDLGFKVNFSSRLLIRKVAFNIILMKKIIRQSRGVELIRLIPSKVMTYGKDFVKDYKVLSSDAELHPFFEKTIFKLQKQINEELKQLGLLPLQQIEREKLTVVKKLRQRYNTIEKEYLVKAEKSKNTHLKENLSAPSSDLIQRDSTKS